jgi:SAM-dependent methyltransferase
MAEVLDLDAEVLAGFLDDVTAQAAQLADGPVRRVVDLGAGTGAGTLALLRRFPGAHVDAVDSSAELLARLEARAAALGLAGQVRTVLADLDAGWPDPGGSGAEGPDLVWASSSLHHLADPARVLAAVAGALRPGGLLVVVELSAFPRFLPEDAGVGRPGLEERLHAALDAQRAEELPHLGADWGPRLTAAGLAVVAEREVAIELAEPLPVAVGRYAQASLRRLRDGVADRLAADDRAALGALVDGSGPGSLLRRGDLTVRTARSVWIARRP